MTDSHLVVKKEDIEKYLADEEKETLREYLYKISNGRVRDNKKAVNNYYICNMDEPYANEVFEVISTGEEKKFRDEIKLQHTRTDCNKCYIGEEICGCIPGSRKCKESYFTKASVIWSNVKGALEIIGVIIVLVIVFACMASSNVLVK